MPPVRRSSALTKYQAITVDNIMDIIAGQAMGFHFGKPKRVEEKALAVVLPILRDGEIGRSYITYPEITDQVIASDSGIINKVNLKNNSDQRVFIRSGTVFEGTGTQSRTITRSAILFPGKEVSLDARCVHASHGIRSGADFGYHGIISLDMEKAVYTAGFTPRDQDTYWQNVQASNTLKSAYMSMNMDVAPEDDMRISCSSLAPEETELTRGGYHSFMERPQGGASQPGGFSGRIRASGSGRNAARAGSPPFAPRPFGGIARGQSIPAHDNYAANDTVFTANLDQILSKVKLHDHQVGISLITDRGVETVELFEMDKSWAALHKDSVKRMGTELIKEEKEDVFEYKPEKAIEQVTRVLAQNYDANVIYEHKADGADKVVITGLTSATHIGEVVELGGSVIHLSLLKRAA